MIDNKYFDLSNEVSSALNNNIPIVALESTLISHGLPYPENLNVVHSSIKAIKESNSVPATIGIVNGKIKIGLNNEEIELFAKNKKIEKVSKHNLSLVLSNKSNGATTVASTIFLASKIGINFFATGGIGGVHLDVENTFDISSDLNELSQTKMFIVCSGVKSILDIEKTYEKLETLGIPRIGYKTDYMPGFWYYQTNKKVDFNFKEINKLVDYLHIHANTNMRNSVLILNPVPKIKAVEKTKINKWIKKALKKAKTNSISGRELTPYLIKEINSLSGKSCLDSNISLIINNASLAGKLANLYN